jgi:hypothetical protein
VSRFSASPAFERQSSSSGSQLLADSVSFPVFSAKFVEELEADLAPDYSLETSSYPESTAASPVPSEFPASLFSST